MPDHLRGLIAATYTPFTADGSLNLEVIPHYAELLRSNGVKSAFVCGTTGEFTSLTVTERMQLAEAWIRADSGSLRVIIHVGHTAITEARSLAAHAAETGAHSIACMAPGFFKPQSATELVDWCAAVAEAAPHLPFHYYHMPSMNGVAIPVVAFIAEAIERIPSFAGIKFSHEDMDEFAECVRLAGDRYDMLMGRDELLLDALERGAQGAVGSTYNYASPLYTQIIADHTSGALASAWALQKRAAEMIQICSGFGVTHIATSKTLMKMLGVDCGQVRLPLRALGIGQEQELHARLQSAGFSDFASQPCTTAAVAAM